MEPIVPLDAVGSNLINNNVVEGIVVNYRDITEQKKAEDKLHREEQLFRSVTEQSSDIIIVANKEGDYNLRKSGS